MPHATHSARGNPVEPGARTLEAQRPGFETAKRVVFAEAGKEQSIELELLPPKDVPASTAATDLTSTAPLPASGERSTSASPRAGGASFNWVPAVVGGALALGGAGMFLGFTAAANDDEDELEALGDKYGPSACAPATVDKLSQCASIDETGRSLDRNRNWATAGIVLAGTAVVGTAAYYLVDSALSSPGTASSSTRGRPSARVGAEISRGAASISILGTF